MRRFPDLSIYARAFPLLARNPSVFVAPLLGAVVAILLDQIGIYATSQIGSLGTQLLTWVAEIFYFYAFAVAIIQADAIERRLKGTFDSAWEDARRKAGGIIVAAIGFWFLYYIALDIGVLFRSAALVFALELVVAFFLIYVIPAAAIGGLPGQFAIAGSIRAVRGEVVGTAILAVAFVVFFEFLPLYVTALIAQRALLSEVESRLLLAFLQALALGYLAFPFAKQYADVAYRV